MEILRENTGIKELGNNNLVIEYDSDTMEEARKDEMLTFSEVIGGLDTYIVGEPFCISNFDMGILLYNSYSDRCYIISYSELERIKAGEKVELTAIAPTEEDRETIAAEGL